MLTQSLVCGMLEIVADTPKRKPVVLPPDLHAEIRLMAFNAQISMTALVAKLLREAIERVKKDA